MPGLTRSAIRLRFSLSKFSVGAGNMTAPSVFMSPILVLTLAACAQPSGVDEGGLFDEAPLPSRLGRSHPRTHSMPDSMAAGCALFDADGDGDLDIYLANGATPGDSPDSGRNVFLRQESDGSFVDATAETGLGHEGFGMGVAVGDYDDDGDADVYVTNHGPDVLYRNEGDGTFVDVTAGSGLGDPGWGASAGFVDFDGDADLDLFVTRYLELPPELRVRDTGGQPEYPGPECCPGLPDLLYRNDGGRFVDVSSETGIGSLAGKGLGLAFWDLDGDGAAEIFVANDGEPNRLWRRGEGRRFEDVAAELGVAVNVYGAPEASMGVACADVNDDLVPDLLLTHLGQETNTLLLSEGGRFRDATRDSGLGAPSLRYTGFGAAWLDYDLDGRLDLAVGNGRVRRAAGAAASGDHWAAYAEPFLLFRNVGETRFALETRCGAPCAASSVVRGLAVGDVDDDGAPDILWSGADGSARLFLNRGPGARRWLRLRVRERPDAGDAVGATVAVAAEGRTRVRRVDPAGSYLSSHDPRPLFGLGTAAVERVTVRWRDGAVEDFGPLAPDREHELIRGTGRPGP